jgi:hypothetical protein
MKWVDEIANRKRLEELFFREEIFLIRWSDYLIWSTKFYFTTSSFNSSCMKNSITSCICLFETIRIVDFSSICWFRVESFYDHSIEMIYSNRDNFFHIYWFSRSSRNQWTRKWVCDFDEIKSKWQRNSRITWSKKNLRDERRSRFSEKSRWIMKWEINKWDCKEKTFISWDDFLI